MSHGGICVRVHQCRISKTNSSTESNTLSENESTKVRNNQQINETEQDISDSGTEEDSSTHQENVVDAPCQELATGSLMDLKKGQVVKYRNVQDGENCVAKVIGRAGKATGKHRNWYNMSYLEPESHKGAESAGVRNL